jgi:hypothetical protein
MVSRQQEQATGSESQLGNGVEACACPLSLCIPCVCCLQAKPENLVDTFILLMPPASKTQQDLARVCELKVGWRGAHDARAGL